LTLTGLLMEGLDVPVQDRFVYHVDHYFPEGPN
jgi:hypothetical protein